MKEKENRLKEVKKNLAEKDRERPSLPSLPRAAFPTQAVKLGELPSVTEEEISLENIFPLNSSTGTRTTTLEVLKSLLFDELIGTIQTFSFLPDGKLPENYLTCDGGSHKIEDYPKLAAKLGKMFNQNDDPSDSFRVPDLRGRFIRGNDPGNIFAVPQDDTMRKILGTGYFQGVPQDKSRFGGSLYLSATNPEDNTAMDGHSTFWSSGNAIFDSSLGVEGQEGTASPNVGSETRPKNLPLHFAIRAK